MDKISLTDNQSIFDATLLKADKPTRLVLFAVGSGGSPVRHLPFLTSLADHGCTVIAPHFEQLVSSRSSSDDILLRAQRLRIALDFIYLERLVLLAPPTGYFQAPLALAGVSLPVQVWAGTNDTVTPPEQAMFLKRVLEPRVPVDLRVIEGAGHFTFLSTLPPQIVDPFVAREIFLADLAADVCAFVSVTGDIE